MKAFNNNIVDEFRANGGKVGGPFEGADLLLLTTTGAKSGEPRLAPLAYLSVDGKTIIIGSYAGADIHPAWVHNLRANPRAHVEVGTTDSTCWPASCRRQSATRSSPRSSRPRPASPITSRRRAGSSRCSNSCVPSRDVISVRKRALSACQRAEIARAAR